MLVSVIIPVFNEENTIEKVLASVLGRTEVSEIVVVDDGSTDAGPSIIKKIAENNGKVKYYNLIKNSGKGRAVNEALKHISGEVVIIQDADLEYDPENYPLLLAPFNDPEIDVVYGSRLLKKGNGISYFSFALGGIMLTLLTDLLYFSRITDEPTGYKVFRKKVLDSINFESRGFEFCPEVTAKVLRKGIKIHEVPITYYPRSIAEGKKIRFRDGIIAVLTLLKYRFHK